MHATRFTSLTPSSSFTHSVHVLLGKALRAVLFIEVDVSYSVLFGVSRTGADVPPCGAAYRSELVHTRTLSE